MDKRRHPKKKPRPDPESSEDESGEEDERILFFVPSAGINIEVLVFYIKLYLGSDSDAEPGTHPQQRDEVGYYVRSRLSLNAVMISDLKKDTAAWKLERGRSKSKAPDDYIRSVTAAQRRQQGASGRPSIPAATAERVAKRAESKPPLTNQIAQSGSGGQKPTNRHQDSRDTPMMGASPPFPDQYMPVQSTARYPDYGVQPQPNYSAGNFGQPTTQTNRHNQAQPYVNVSVASFSVNPQQQQRHGSPQGQSVVNPLPSIEGRFSTPAPPYTEDEDRKPNRPSQPSTTGAQGWQSINPTAGPKYYR